MHEIILATRNPNKVEEIQSILAFLPVKFCSLLDLREIPDIIENGSTLEENAFIKARYLYQTLKLPALADDSGLEVFALDLRPGVYSARYAGENVSYEANNNKLLAELASVPAEMRNARFRCVAAFVAPATEHAVEGVCHGTIIDAPRGVGGFGYDPLFVPDGYHDTFAELSSEVKNSISHRSIAFRSMGDYLRRYFMKMERAGNSQEF